jgi:hypothetical protein
MVGRLAFGVVQMPGGWRSDWDAIRVRHSMSWEAAEAGSSYSYARQLCSPPKNGGGFAVELPRVGRHIPAWQLTILDED